MVKIVVKFIKSGESHKVKGDIRTIGELKSKIERCHRIPYGEQILLHNNKLMLYDGKELVALGIDTSAKMNLYSKISPQMIQLKIVSKKNDSFYLDILSNETVLRLKMLIDERFGLSPHRQRLFASTEDELAEQDVLDEYILKVNKNALYLREIPIDQLQILRIRIQVNGLPNRVKVERSDTIYTLHGEARRRGLASGSKFFFRWGQEHLRGQMTFAWYGIENKAMVQLVEEEEEEEEEEDEDEDEDDDDNDEDDDDGDDDAQP